MDKKSEKRQLGLFHPEEEEGSAVLETIGQNVSSETT